MENSLTLQSSFPPVSNLNAYKSYVSSIPNLTDKQERSLLESLKTKNCLKSAQKLILSQLKTVVHIVKQYRNYGLMEEDLIQEGNIGLMKAVKNYDVKYKVRLYSYALIWIKAEIQAYILKNWKIVKIGTTKNLKKLFFNFRQIQKEMIDLGIPKNQLETIVAEKLNVDEKDVKDISGYFGSSDLSVDLNYNNEEDESLPIIELKEEKTPEMEFMQKHDANKRDILIDKVFNKLNDRQKEVIRWRFLEDEKKTHKEIASILNISSERVRQIENESISKMKKIVLKDYNINESF